MRKRQWERVAEALRRARDERLATEDTWAPLGPAQNEQAYIVPATSPDAIRWGTAAAVESLPDTTGWIVSRCTRMLQRAIPGGWAGTVHTYNDTYGRTFEDVQTVYRSAILNAETLASGAKY